MRIFEEQGEFIRVREEIARRLYREGYDVFLVPCKVPLNFKSKWIVPHKINLALCKNERFEKVRNQYTYYNCQNYKLGIYPHYWVYKKDVLEYDAR